MLKALILFFILFIMITLPYIIENTDNKKKEDIVVKYLIYAVAIAEQVFGSKTGKLKLAKVYKDFVVEMPNMAKYIPYETFCKLVDQALIQLNEMLKNKNIDEIINGD